MQPADFTALSADDQSNALYYEGSILANRYEDDSIFLLYSLYDFFVELHHDAYTSQVRQVTAFRDTDRLDPYLPYLAEV